MSDKDYLDLIEETLEEDPFELYGESFDPDENYPKIHLNLIQCYCLFHK